MRVRTTHLRRLAHVVAVGAVLMAPVPLRAQRSVAFERVSAHSLEIPIPGVAVVRDSARWATLWRRFGQLAYAESGRVRHVPPPIDFRRHMLVVVVGRMTSGCGNQGSFVGRVLDEGDTVVVRLGVPADGGNGVTCGMIVHPIEVVRIPASARPVVFRGGRGITPVPARWWEMPGEAALDRMQEEERRVFMSALARDPRTPAATIAAIARRLTPADWTISGLLMERPDVVRDPRILTELALMERDAGRGARKLLFDRYGLALARDPRTPVRTLRALVDEFTHRDPPPLDVSRALARHPGVLADRELLRRFAGEVTPHAEIHAAACRAYLARYPVWEPVRDAAGRVVPGQWSSSVPCRDLPPSPSAPGGGGR